MNRFVLDGLWVARESRERPAKGAGSFATTPGFPEHSSSVGMRFAMRRIPGWLIILFLTTAALALAGCSTKGSRNHITSARAREPAWCSHQTGVASWYGGRWHRRLTANGERYDQNSLTAAHRKLPFGTKVRVTNVRTGRCCVVRINNRGPYVGRRVIDLSRAAARLIDVYHAGLARVKLEIMR